MLVAFSKTAPEPAFIDGFDHSLTRLDKVSGVVKENEMNNKKKLAKLDAAVMKEVSIDINSKWPGALFEDIAEAAQGRANLCRKAIAESKS